MKQHKMHSNNVYKENEKARTQKTVAKYGLMFVALIVFILFSALIKDRFASQHSTILFVLASVSFVALSVQLFGNGKANKLLSFVFWTVCLLMIVDVRVTSLTEDGNFHENPLNLRSDVGGSNLFVSNKATLDLEVSKDIEEKENKNNFEKKLDSLIQCYHHCEEKDPSNSADMLKDPVQLKYHYVDVLEATKTFRPQKRRKRTIYKSYLGPRLEDHFIHNMFAEPFETFSPLVPLYIHWTEVQYSKAGGGMMKVMSVFEKILRNDVIYFSVASCETDKIQWKLKKMGFRVIFASSKGDPAAHIILPHLFRYNAPAFDASGLSVFNDEKWATLDADYDYSFSSDVSVFQRLSTLNKHELNRAYHEKVVFQREVNNIPKTSPLWRFKNYSAFFSMNEDFDKNSDKQIEVNATFPKFSRFSFVGNLKTHRWRTKIVNSLEKILPEKFVYENFVNNEQCIDFSAGTNYSPCWRTLMLSSGITLAPAGTAPVSYRLYEALQMGLPPLYLYDKRGAFIPYKDTEADISKLGLVVSFENAEATIEQLGSLSNREFSDYTLQIRKQIAKLRDTHFTPHGTVGQIKKWIQFPYDKGASDLRCCKNPIKEVQ